MSLPDAVQSLIGTSCYELAGDALVSQSNVRAMCAVVENPNAAYWDEERTPTTMLSTWSRPEYWSPERDGEFKALQLHYDLKELLRYPTAIVSSFESVFHRPARVGDRVSSVQTLKSISEEKTTRLGTGRFWEIEVRYTNQEEALLGVEIFNCFGYRKGSSDD